MEDLPSDQREDETPVTYPRAKPATLRRNNWRTLDLIIAGASLVYGLISYFAIWFERPTHIDTAAISLLVAVIIAILAFRGTPLFWIVAMPVALFWRFVLWVTIEDFDSAITVGVMRAGTGIWAIVAYAALRSILNLVHLIRPDRSS